MNLNMTNFLFVNNIVNNLDPIYYEKLNFNTDKIFTYSNILDIPMYYNKKNTYNLSKRLKEQKMKDYILNMIKYIKNNNYNHNNSLLLYAIASQIILHKYIQDYTNLYQLDYYYAKKNGYNLDKINMATFFDKSFILDFYDLEFLKNTINNTFYFPHFDLITLKSIKKFKRSVNKKSLLNKAYKEKTTMTLEEFNNTDFIKDVEIAQKETFRLISAINDYLYLNTTNSLDAFFNTFKY